MGEKDFAGTLVLEQLAVIGRAEEFFDAIDSDRVQRVVSLMKKAQDRLLHNRDGFRKIEDADGEH
jgi:hypothetical protein